MPRPGPTGGPWTDWRALSAQFWPRRAPTSRGNVGVEGAERGREGVREWVCVRVVVVIVVIVVVDGDGVAGGGGVDAGVVGVPLYPLHTIVLCVALRGSAWPKPPTDVENWPDGGSLFPLIAPLHNSIAAARPPLAKRLRNHVRSPFRAARRGHWPPAVCIVCPTAGLVSAGPAARQREPLPKPPWSSS